MRHRILFLAILFLFIIACASQQSNTYKTKGVYHSVKKGETISDIARAYNTNPGKLADINHIKNPGRLEENSVVFIPDAVSVLDIEKSKESGTKNHRTQSAQKKAGGRGKEKPLDAPPPPQLSAGANSAVKGLFAWPVRGRVSANFGRQPNGMVNNHIRITARDHAPVVAAATGTVIFSEPLKNFGETIIIKHDNQFATVYTNLGNRSAKADSRVKKNEVIGLTGKSGKKGEGYIDFEIRQNNKARNPLLFLP
ncbi:MAG: peptidoglycan DD-metalloendopeptidase family protein [Syntrophales bacterium]